MQPLPVLLRNGMQNIGWHRKKLNRIIFILHKYFCPSWFYPCRSPTFVLIYWEDIVSSFFQKSRHFLAPNLLLSIHSAKINMLSSYFLKSSWITSRIIILHINKTEKMQRILITYTLISEINSNNTMIERAFIYLFILKTFPLLNVCCMLYKGRQVPACIQAP